MEGGDDSIGGVLSLVHGSVPAVALITSASMGRRYRWPCLCLWVVVQTLSTRKEARTVEDRLTKMVKNYPRNFVNTATEFIVEGFFFCLCIMAMILPWVTVPYVFAVIGYFTPLGIEIGFGFGICLAFPLGIIAFFACINKGQSVRMETKRGLSIREETKE